MMTKVRRPGCAAVFDLQESVDKTFHCPECGQHLGIGQMDRSRVERNQFSDPTSPNLQTISTNEEGAAPGDENPYQAPGLIGDSTMPLHRTGDQVPDRSGTAWERSDRYLHGFIITLCLVTFSPKQALKEMRLDDGVGPAFRFNFWVVSIVSFAIWLSILWLSILYYEFDGETVVFSGLSIFFVGCLWATVVPFGLGGLLHIALRILGAGRYRYANTAKVALYLNGIMLAYGGLLQFIPVPLLNLLISLLLFGAYYGLSLSAALQTTVLKGVSACLITVLISWGFVIAIFAGLFAVCIVAYT